MEFQIIFAYSVYFAVENFVPVFKARSAGTFVVGFCEEFPGARLCRRDQPQRFRKHEALDILPVAFAIRLLRLVSATHPQSAFVVAVRAVPWR